MEAADKWIKEDIVGNCGNDFRILDSVEEIEGLVNIICLYNRLNVINKWTSSPNDCSEYS